MSFFRVILYAVEGDLHSIVFYRKSLSLVSMLIMDQVNFYHMHGAENVWNWSFCKMISTLTRWLIVSYKNTFSKSWAFYKFQEILQNKWINVYYTVVMSKTLLDLITPLKKIQSRDTHIVSNLKNLMYSLAEWHFFVDWVRLSVYFWLSKSVRLRRFDWVSLPVCSFW